MSTNRPKPKLSERIRQKVKTLKSSIRYFIPRLKAKYKSYKKNKAIDKELATPFKDNMKQVIWQNFLNYQQAQNHGLKPTANTKNTNNNRIFARIARKVIDNLDLIKPFVGIQPMQGPVGLVYTMDYKEAPSADQDGTIKIRLEIVSQAVEAVTRKLHASWSLEAVQDMQAFHGFDIEDEIINIVGQEILFELTSELISTATNLNTIEQHNIRSLEQLGLYINKAANEIAQNSRRGIGNFIVVTPLLLSMIQSSPSLSFVSIAKEQRQKHDYAPIVYEGILNGLMKVYSTLSLPSNANCLVGYKGGNGETDAGLIYAPYIPVIGGPVIVDPATFQPRIGMSTRFGLLIKNTDLVVAKDYYRTLNIELDLSTNDVETPVKATRRKKVVDQPMVSSLPAITLTKEKKPVKKTTKKADKVETGTTSTRTVKQPAKTGTVSKKAIEKAVKTVSDKRKETAPKKAK